MALFVIAIIGFMHDCLIIGSTAYGSPNKCFNNRYIATFNGWTGDSCIILVITKNLVHQRVDRGWPILYRELQGHTE